MTWQMEESRSTRTALHLNLDISYGDIVVTVSNGINNQFSPAKFREFGNGDEQTIFAEERVLMDLGLYKFCRFPHHIENVAFEDNILRITKTF